VAQPYAHLHDDNINIIIVQETRAGMQPAPASSMQEASSATMTTKEGSKACMQLKHATHWVNRPTATIATRTIHTKY